MYPKIICKVIIQKWTQKFLFNVSFILDTHVNICITTYSRTLLKQTEFGFYFQKYSLSFSLSLSVSPLVVSFYFILIMLLFYSTFFFNLVFTNFILYSNSILFYSIIALYHPVTMLLHFSSKFPLF